MSDYTDFMALRAAVEVTATQHNISREGAWRTLKRAIEMGDIKTRCLSLRYHKPDRRHIDVWEVIDPQWMPFLAYPNFENDRLRFDTAAAIIAQKSGFRGQLPPEHARDVSVDKNRLDHLEKLRPEWPRDKAEISLRDAAALVEPFLPPGPISKHHNLPANSVQATAVVRERVRELSARLLIFARSAEIPMRHPTLSLSVAEPDENWYIDREGFDALANALRLDAPEGKPSQASVNDWMRDNVNPMTKREAALLDCRTLTRATYRQALAAWNALPAAQRKTRGRPAGVTLPVDGTNKKSGA
jgi:hypothetical protein